MFSVFLEYIFDSVCYFKSVIYFLVHNVVVSNQLSSAPNHNEHVIKHYELTYFIVTYYEVMFSCLWVHQHNT